VEEEVSSLEITFETKSFLKGAGGVLDFAYHLVFER
jgi:hypothetical protein